MLLAQQGTLCVPGELQLRVRYWKLIFIFLVLNTDAQARGPVRADRKLTLSNRGIWWA